MSPKRSSIAELAYQLWVKRGCPEGSDEIDWLEAERQITAAENNSPPESGVIREGKVGSSPDAAATTHETLKRGTESATKSASERRPRNKHPRRDKAVRGNSDHDRRE